jgi:radical SAM superfamily enzyme YgiQ (UPF0313 family)
MKVCLISPPTVSDFIEREVLESEAHKLIVQYAPVGILTLAAVLDGLGVDIHLLDLNRFFYDHLNLDSRHEPGNDLVSGVVRQLEGTHFDVIGFGTICSTYPLTLRLAREIRRTHPEAVILLGGPQASVVDESTLVTFPFVDFILRGEAEETLPQLLDALSSGGASIKNVQGITYRSGSEVIRNPNAPVIENLDALPLPAFHFYSDVQKYGFLPLEAGRGCPFACSFCSTNDFFRRRYRMKSPEVLVGQMRDLKQRYKVNFFELVHDMFTADKKRVMDFCNAVIRSGEQLYWNCSARTDCADDELLSLMARAGCRGIFFGIDSGSERMQQQMNKGLSITESLSRVRRANTYKMSTTVSLIAGFPDETEEDLRATVNFIGEALRSRRASPQFHLLAPLAETPVATEYKGRLVFDETYSDQSFHEWSKTSEERAMIIEHPDIFTNFHSIPTRWLSRRRLRYLRDFILIGAACHRWLLLLLHHMSGDLVEVFDDWMTWRANSRRPRLDDPIPYELYPSATFRKDLLSFVRAKYLDSGDAYAHLVGTVVAVDEAMLSLSEGAVRGESNLPPREVKKAVEISLNTVPEISGHVRLLQVQSDYGKIVKCLIRNSDLARLPVVPQPLVVARAGEGHQITKHSQRSYNLLRLCDGSRTIREIIDYSALSGRVADIPAEKANLYGLVLLLKQGLIKVREAGSEHSARGNLAIIKSGFDHLERVL